MARFHSKLVIDKLRDDATLQTLRGDGVKKKVYIHKIPQKTVLPAQVTFAVSTVPDQNFDGVALVDYVVFQVSTFAKTYLSAKNIADQTRVVLDKLAATVTGVNIEGIEFEDEYEDYDTTANAHHIIQEYRARVKN